MGTTFTHVLTLAISVGTETAKGATGVPIRAYSVLAHSPLLRVD